VPLVGEGGGGINETTSHDETQVLSDFLRPPFLMSLCRDFGAAVSRAQRGEAPQREERAGRARGLAVLVNAEIALERAGAINAANAQSNNNQDNINAIEITPDVQRLLDFMDAAAPRDVGVGAEVDLNNGAQAAVVPPPPIVIDNNAGKRY
jgi:hypothetical protein